MNHARQMDGNGDARTHVAIDKLNSQIMTKGDKWKSHYHALVGWVKDWIYEQEQKKVMVYPKAARPMRTTDEGRHPTYCRECEKWFPTHDDWAAHDPCNSPQEDAGKATLQETVDLLKGKYGKKARE